MVASGTESYEPEVLVWIGGNGAVLGSRTAKPGEVLAAASESLTQAIERPLVGQPHRPGRLRVASLALADLLRSSHPDLEIVCAPTPEIDVLADKMRKQLAERDMAISSYLGRGSSPELVAEFFSAAATLFRALDRGAPASGECDLMFDIESYGVCDRALVMLEQVGAPCTFVWFERVQDLDAFRAAADAAAAGERAFVPAHATLSFERGADVSPALRKEIAAHGWEVASALAFPLLAVKNEGMFQREADASELKLAATVALALADALAGGDAPAANGLRGASFDHGCVVVVEDVDVKVRLRARDGALE